MYLQGSTSIGNGQNTVTVTFPTPFEAAPGVILVTIENTTDSSPLQRLDPTVKSKSASGFVVELAATVLTANYKLVWSAGVPSAEYQGVAAAATKITALPKRTTAPDPSDLLATVSMTGTPAVNQMTWAVVYALFGRFTSAPSGPGAPGAQGNWAIDENFLYTHDGVLWGRSPRVTTNWNIPAEHEMVQEGTTDLVEGSQSISITYSQAFMESPMLEFSFENTEVESTKQIINGLVISRSHTGFTVLLNTAPDSGNYKISWRATGLPPA